MKKTLIFFVIIISCFGCKKNADEINGVTVNLIADDDSVIFKKSVILFDDDSYRIKTPLDTFLIGYPFLWSGYSDLKTQAINDGLINDILLASDYYKLSKDSIYTIAYYMETGNCYLFDKQSDKSIKTILVETYSEGEPMMMYGGRRFYVKNKLFLETVDFITK